MYQLYIANKNYSSWSLRPWVLMRERGIDFDERLMVFADPESNWEAFRAFSPSGRVPCLVDGETTVWDSLAIVEYLAERHQGVWPADAAARAWARCAAAEMHSSFGALRECCPMNCGIRLRPKAIPEALQRDIDRLDELWSQGLARFGGPFLAGAAFSAADAFYAPVVFRVQTYGLQLSSDGAQYVQRLLALPAMQSWYADALREPWREVEHEAETRAFGDLLEDLREPV
ncbi:MAG: glutathione S-transferase [Pseudomonadales bacterium]